MAISGDYGERLRFFEQARGELLTNIRASQELQQGLGAYAVVAVNYLERAYLANNDNGQIVLNDPGQEGTDWPVVVVRPGETARVTGNIATQTPRQRQRDAVVLQNCYNGSLDRQAVRAIPDRLQQAANTWYTNHAKKYLTIGASDATGSCNASTPIFELAPNLPGASLRVQVWQRPVVGLQLNPINPINARQVPAVLLHEFKHTDYAEEYPVRPTHPASAQEWWAIDGSSAYEMAGVYESVLHAAGHPPYQKDNGRIMMRGSEVTAAVRRYTAGVTDSQMRIQRTIEGLASVGITY